ncbi:hypothetical protein D7X94_03125 [Acutalibacter sp. 1XD8-33]|nr:hypothetical protein D7X94_03125 [Acutalibacter sp. 1XD8-33]
MASGGEGFVSPAGSVGSQLCLQYLALPSIRQNAHPLHPAKLFEKKFKTLPSVSLKNFYPG